MPVITWNRAISIKLSLICLVILCLGCRNSRLEIVTIEAFETFVQESGYVTDAEKFGWTIVQHDVSNFEIRDSLFWYNAYDSLVEKNLLPVTQVSYNDALAYANWSGTILPDYKTYWKLTEGISGIINKATTSILPVDQCHIIGNTWELTSPDTYGRIRLAGGSYLCNDNSCNGTAPNRELYIDPMTANSHIGFAVISRE